MAEPQAKSPRQTALVVLNLFKAGGGNIGELLEGEIRNTSRPGQATDISFGVIKNRFIIDKIISQVSAAPTERISRKLLNILRIAVYELVFTNIDAEYAIVNEAVELALSVSGEKSAGFVNAVLRKTCRNITNRDVALEHSDVKKTVPKTLQSGCEFGFEILPTPNIEQADYLSDAFSLPRWLVQLWLDEFGYEKSREICFASNRRSSLYLRPNTLRITVEKLLEKLKTEHVNCELVASANMIRLENPGKISSLPGFDDGLFSVQDISASMAVKKLAPQKGQTIVDLCAAPGGKTTQIAELMGDFGRVIATDINGGRLKKVAENCSRLKIKSVAITDYDNIESVFSETNSIDAVIVDVPCSNTGVLAKRCEVRDRLKQKQLENLCKIQLKLLKKAAKLTKAGGKICYSTCSILKQENNQLIKQFLEAESNFVVEQEGLVLPSTQEPDCDGSYSAIIVKT